jgi:hypothetical protein
MSNKKNYTPPNSIPPLSVTPNPHSGTANGLSLPSYDGLKPGSLLPPHGKK